MFLNSDAALSAVAEKHGISKTDILDPMSGEGGNSVAVKMTLAETQIIADTKSFFKEHGINISVFDSSDDLSSILRCNKTIIVKNLPSGTDEQSLRKLFVRFGDLKAFLIPPSGTIAIVGFFDPSSAKAAFSKLAYSKFKHVPLYLEWAPASLIPDSFSPAIQHKPGLDPEMEEDQKILQEMAAEDLNSVGSSLFVKNRKDGYVSLL